MCEARINEINEYNRLDLELLDAQDAEDEQAITRVTERIKEFEARSKFIDFSNKSKPHKRSTSSRGINGTIELPTFSSHLDKE